MSYLSRLPLDELKIDRSFVARMKEDPRDASIVQSTIGLGHALGLTVVAEGIEDHETLQLLASLGCDVAQGYFISLPLHPARVQDWSKSGGKVGHAEAAEPGLLLTKRGPAVNV